jgi:hypothetical protein
MPKKQIIGLQGINFYGPQENIAISIVLVNFGEGVEEAIPFIVLLDNCCKFIRNKYCN